MKERRKRGEDYVSHMAENVYRALIGKLDIK
jgi:hypothetical protein